MTAISGKEVAAVLGSASYVKEESAKGLTFPGIFAQMAQDYFSRYGEQSEALARIAAKNHANGAKNPLAHIQKALSFEFCQQVGESNPVVAAPFAVDDINFCFQSLPVYALGKTHQSMLQIDNLR